MSAIDNGSWLLIVPLLGVGLIAVLAAVLAALLERAGHIRLRHWAEQAEGRILALYEDTPRFESFKLLLSVLSRCFPVALVAIGPVFVVRPWQWVPLVTVVALIVIAEWVARRTVSRSAEEALRAFTLAVRGLDRVLYPLSWLLAQWLGRHRVEEENVEDEASEGEIDAYIDVGRKEGILEPEEEDLVRSIVDFGDTQVRQVMMPRVEIVSASGDSTLDQLAEKFIQSKHARLPIFRDSVDHIVGILHIRDLFECHYRQRELNLEELATQPLYVPESKPLPELLEELQGRHLQMAIVVDEYGGVAGLVTVEDLLEEIVGEITDEHETGPNEAIELENGSWRLPGRLELEDIPETFRDGFDLSAVQYETVSGMLCGELGYVPAVGERVEVEGLRFEIEEADERRVLMAKVYGRTNSDASIRE